MNVALLGADAALAGALAGLADTLLVLDADGASARSVAAPFAGAQAAAVDPADRASLMLALDGCAVLVDAVGAGDAAADAALTAGVDLVAATLSDAVGDAFAAAGRSAVVCADLAAGVRALADGLVDDFGYPRTGRVDL